MFEEHKPLYERRKSYKFNLACGFERIVCQESQQKIFLKHIFREKWFFFGLIRLFVCWQASSANIGLLPSLLCYRKVCPDKFSSHQSCLSRIGTVITRQETQEQRSIRKLTITICISEKKSTLRSIRELTVTYVQSENSPTTIAEDRKTLPSQSRRLVVSFDLFNNSNL